MSINIHNLKTCYMFLCFSLRQVFYANMTDLLLCRLKITRFISVSVHIQNVGRLIILIIDLVAVIKRYLVELCSLLYL